VICVGSRHSAFGCRLRQQQNRHGSHGPWGHGFHGYFRLAAGCSLRASLQLDHCIELLFMIVPTIVSGRNRMVQRRRSHHFTC
jgi:hypothetical protein